MVLPGPAAVTVGAGGVLIRGDGVLLVRLTYGPSQGRWILPGGYQEPGETLAEAAERELLEETGVRGMATRLLAVRSLAAEGRSDTYFAFAMEDLGGEPTPDGKEVAEAAFRPAAWVVGSPEVAALSRTMVEEALADRGLVVRPFEALPPRAGIRRYVLYGGPRP